ncbi:mitochondrial genome maintenance exonuclease 1-like isoform X1 [Globicephala melas]|uniref:mitochondrial genome maintenance exonuclease 1-like isoform X1 n=1 Tax=Globicephala melas TaxID=9731 RepID=UPI00122EE42F|nr:mitochondrial genome maintenance exonuclease 1-like isoform X1 [Globicephala melas]
MQVFQTICRQLISSKGFSVEPAPSVVFSTSSYMCGRKKKVNRYEEEDPKKYSDLVRSVLSFRGHAQTPQPLFEEDALLYGPVRKCKAPKQEEGAGDPRNWGPLFNPEKSGKPNDPTVPLKIPLQRNMIPRVTRVLQQTMNSEQISCLERWKQWMILELGEDGFAEYTSNMFLQGKWFHEALESILSPQGNLRERDENLLKSGYIQRVQHVLRDVSGVWALENAVRRDTLKYVGLLHCVADYQGKLCVTDRKTSEKPKPFIRNTFDNLLQVVVYVSAINHKANYSFQVQCGLIVVAYKDGSPAHPHFMDAELCSQY